MPKNRLQQLHDAGQSIWLDYIDRPMLLNGDLERRIREDALMGMTSNPTIFEKALAEGSAYDQQLASVPLDLTPWQLFEVIATHDVRTACDLFWHVYQRSDAADGYVSIEVSPGVARDADEADGNAALPGDRAHHADRQVARLQHRPLLDMHLAVAQQVVAAPPRLP